MVRITQGKTLPLTQLANMHWEELNKTTGGRYYVYALISKVIQVHDEHVTAGRFHHAAYYAELLAEECQLLKGLIICRPDDMPAVIKHMDGLHHKYQLTKSSASSADFGYELLTRVFQYDNWRTSNACGTLFEWLGIEVCPYCNAEIVFRDYTRDFVVVSFDHFYDKATYPYLALSFYNLIPACKICNETYKNTRPFSIDSHLHPYLDCYNERNTFDHNYYEGCTDYAVTIRHAQTDSQSETYNKDLGLLTRYNVPQLREIAEQTYLETQLYPPERKLELVSDWRLTTIHEVEQRISKIKGIPFKQAEITNKLFGKLKRDFAFKSKLIDRHNPLL